MLASLKAEFLLRQKAGEADGGAWLKISRPRFLVTGI